MSVDETYTSHRCRRFRAFLNVGSAWFGLPNNLPALTCPEGQLPHELRLLIYRIEIEKRIKISLK